ncbi:MAG: hypothetical protein HYX83_02705 [Chloroflexi bacterium]|nr:hypothetical protein [Chloroflexota bacterium]
MWCIHDTIELEKRGVPTATFATDLFAHLARFIAGSKGLPDLPLIIVPHPVGGIPADKAKAKADHVIDEIVRLLTEPREKLIAEQKAKAALHKTS